MFDYYVEIKPQEKDWRVIVTIDNQIYWDEVYDSYIIAAQQAEFAIQDAYRKRGEHW